MRSDCSPEPAVVNGCLRRCPTILPWCGQSRRPGETRRAPGRQPSGWPWRRSSPSAARGAHPVAASALAAAGGWRLRARGSGRSGACATGRGHPAACSSTCRAGGVALVCYASIGWSLTLQTSVRRRQPLAVAAAAAACGVLLANLLRRPLELGHLGAVRRRAAAVAYAIQQRAHGVFFQTSPRLQGVLGYPNAIGAYARWRRPAALWLAARAARPPRGGLRDALRRSSSRSRWRPRAAGCWRRSSAVRRSWR